MPEGLERVKGIEPSSSAWEAAALPLSYTRALTPLIAALFARQALAQNGISSSISAGPAGLELP